MLVTTNVCLLQQNTFFLLWHKYACHNKTFVMTKLCLLQQIFVMTKVLSRQAWQRFCRDKHTFVVTKDMFCHNKTLSWQKWYLLQLPSVISVCRFVVRGYKGIGCHNRKDLGLNARHSAWVYIYIDLYIYVMSTTERWMEYVPLCCVRVHRHWTSQLGRELVDGGVAVSYTHLTLPTRSTV